MWTQYLGKLNGETFAEIVKKDFPKAFRDSINLKNKLFLLDGNPTQNSQKAKTAFDAIGWKVFATPARSPEVNAIKNIFNRIRENLIEDPIMNRIKRENFKEFSAQVKRTFAEFPVEGMVKTIDSMQKRIKPIPRSCG